VTTFVIALSVLGKLALTAIPVLVLTFAYLRFRRWRERDRRPGYIVGHDPKLYEKRVAAQRRRLP
jgi:hypothetical protein